MDSNVKFEVLLCEPESKHTGGNSKLIHSLQCYSHVLLNSCKRREYLCICECECG